MSLRARIAAVAIALSAHAGPAMAADRDPLEYPLKQWALVLGTALLGGLVSFYAKVRAGKVQAWNFMHLVGELTTSAFSGLMAFWFCELVGAPQLLTVCIVGISGHMGARAIAAMESAAERRFNQVTGSPGEQRKETP